MGGLKKYMPITFATMLTGWLAISGIPIFAGFFSKDEILWKTWSAQTVAIPFAASKILWGIGALTALLTAIYMTRMMVMTFWGEERFLEAAAGGQADEAHAHAYDEGTKPHAARADSAGDRPHHEAGEHVSETQTHAGASHGATATHDAHGDDAHGHHGAHIPHESPWTMTVPLVVLAILSTLGGLVGVPYALSGGAIPNYFEHTLEPAVARAPENKAGSGGESHGAADTGHGAQGPEFLSRAPQAHDGATPLTVGEGAQGAGAHPAEHAHDPEEVKWERIFSAISVAIALAGIGIGWTMFRRRPLLEMPRILENKYYVDEVYDAGIVNPIKVGSREGLWRLFDVGVVDGIVNGLGRAVSNIGGLLRYLQPGFVRSYAAIILIGALAVIAFFAYSAYKALLLVR